MPVPNFQSAGFGQLIDSDTLKMTKHHIAKEVPGFGELIDPDLIVDTAEIPAVKDMEPPSRPPLPPPEVPASPRIDLGELMAATQELEDVAATQGVDEKDVEQIFDEDIERVGDLALDFDDIDESIAAGILSPRS